MGGGGGASQWPGCKPFGDIHSICPWANTPILVFFKKLLWIYRIFLHDIYAIFGGNATPQLTTSHGQCRISYVSYGKYDFSIEQYGIWKNTPILVFFKQEASRPDSSAV